MPPVVALDRLKSQLLTSGLQQRDNPLYQVINQLIDFLRNSIDATQLQLGDLQQCCDNTKVPVKNVSNAPFPLPFESGESLSDYNPIGYIPGPQGPQGPQGQAGSGSSYFWVEYEDDSPELPALMTLMNVGSIPESSIADGTILARVAANETISGAWTFGAATVFNGSVTINNNVVQIAASPQYITFNSAGALDEKYWRSVISGGSLIYQTVNDAFSVASTYLEYQRVAEVVLNHVLYTNNLGRTVLNGAGLLNHLYGFALSGQSAVALTADQTAWNPSGLGTAFCLIVTPSSTWTIRGITAQASGTLIFIHCTNNNTITITHEDGAASAANRIRCPGTVSVTIGQYNSRFLYYDGVNSRWIVQS